jgi:hypothetical protein
MAGCYHCRLPYKDFPGDLCLPDELWEIISPVEPGRDKEGGLLCPNCIVKALKKKLGVSYVQAFIPEDELVRVLAVTRGRVRNGNG